MTDGKLKSVSYNCSMKLKTFLCSISLIVFISSISYAQKEINNVVKVNPLALLIKYYSFSYERVLSEKTSGQVDLGILDISGGDIKKEDGQVSIAGYRLGIHYRYFVTHAKKATPRGFYVAPYADYGNVKISVSKFDEASQRIVSGNVDASIFGIGTSLGYQWLIADVVSIDLGAGIGYYFLSLSNLQVRYAGTNVTPPSAQDLAKSYQNSGFLPGASFTLGYAF
mgnify:CR=1 FL=1